MDKMETVFAGLDWIDPVQDRNRKKFLVNILMKSVEIC
jgi:hypothetical protein